MTSEMRTTIEPGDIRAIEMECLGCGFRAIRTLLKQFDGFDVCPNCKTSWPVRNSIAFSAFAEYVETLRKLSDLKKDKDFPFVIRFELAENLPKVSP
jgi:hypothetical protein